MAWLPQGGKRRREGKKDNPAKEIKEISDKEKVKSAKLWAGE